MTFLVIMCLAIIVNVGGIALLSRFNHRRADAMEAEHGEIVVDGNAQHRCKPPGCHEWPAGKWYVDNTRKYPEGTVWRCPCGKAWRSSRWAPGYSVLSDSSGLWLNWYRDRKHDASTREDTP